MQQPKMADSEDAISPIGFSHPKRTDKTLADPPVQAATSSLILSEWLVWPLIWSNQLGL